MTEKVRLNLGGRKVEVEVGTEAECEQAAFCVCATADFVSPFTDNVRTVCAGCGTAIVHRPYAPKAPPKICARCAVGWAQAGRA